MRYPLRWLFVCACLSLLPIPKLVLLLVWLIILERAALASPALTTIFWLAAAGTLLAIFFPTSYLYRLAPMLQLTLLVGFWGVAGSLFVAYAIRASNDHETGHETKH